MGMEACLSTSASACAADWLLCEDGGDGQYVRGQRYSDPGSYDIDGELTSVRSPTITLPVGTLSLRFSYYMALASNASSDDYLRISVVEGIPTGQRPIVFERKGAASNVNVARQTASVDLSNDAGQTIYLLIEAADTGTASLLPLG